MRSGERADVQHSTNTASGGQLAALRGAAVSGAPPRPGQQQEECLAGNWTAHGQTGTETNGGGGVGGVGDVSDTPRGPPPQVRQTRAQTTAGYASRQPQIWVRCAGVWQLR